MYSHMEGNSGIYFLVSMFFIIGISAGVFTVKALEPYQKQELINYMRVFFHILNDNPIDSFAVFKQSFINNLQTIVLIWILGITVIGMPLILILVAIRGLIVGFTVGFLVEQLGVRGVVFSIISILPQNLLILPCIIVIAVLGISFSKMLLKNKIFNNSHVQTSIFKQFILYSSIIISIFTVIVLGCIIEAYVTPVLMGLFSKNMM